MDVGFLKILLNPLGGPKRGCAGWRDHWGRLGFNDGWLDNFLVNGTAFGLPPKGPRPTCFRNNRDGTRTEITKKGRIHLLGLGPRLLRARLRQTDSLTCLSRIGATSILPRNNGDGTLTNVSEKAGVAGTGRRWSAGSCFLDYDRDGYVDLFVANYVNFDPDRVPGSG